MTDKGAAAFLGQSSDGARPLCRNTRVLRDVTLRCQNPTSTHYYLTYCMHFVTTCRVQTIFSILTFCHAVMQCYVDTRSAAFFPLVAK